MINVTATAACGHKDDEQADPFRILLVPPEGAILGNSGVEKLIHLTCQNPRRT